MNERPGVSPHLRCLTVGVIVGAVCMGTFACAGDAITAEQSRESMLAQQLVKERKAHKADIRAARRQVRRYRDAINRDQNVQNALTLASAMTGYPRSALARIAFCESGYRAHVVGPRQADGVHVVGLMQFRPDTFTRNYVGRNFTAADRTDPYVAAMAAAHALSRGQSSAWECKAQEAE